MLKNLLLFVFICICGITAFAQTAPTSRLVEQFGIANSGYAKMIADLFAVELQNEPTAQGLIVVTYPKQKNGIRVGKRRLLWIHNYLINTRGVDPARVLFTYSAGEDEQTAMWLVPAGAELPFKEKLELIKSEELKKKLFPPKPKRKLRTKRKTRRYRTKNFVGASTAFASGL